MEESDYDYAFDVFGGCVPSGEKAFSIPMGLLTPKLAKKLATVPKAVYLAKVDEILEISLSIGQNDRGLFGFGECQFEVTAKPNTLVGTEKNMVICFTPYVVSFKDKDYVALRVHGFSRTEYGATIPLSDEAYGGVDPSDLARDAQEQDRAAAYHDATT